MHEHFLFNWCLFNNIQIICRDSLAYGIWLSLKDRSCRGGLTDYVWRRGRTGNRIRRGKIVDIICMKK